METAWQNIVKAAIDLRFLATFSGSVAREVEFPGNEVEHRGHVFHRPVPADFALHG